MDADANIEYFDKKVDNKDGVYFVPAFTGIGAHYWEARAKSSLVGSIRIKILLEQFWKIQVLI